jgi:type VI secretion system VasD/TssJ family lipoprotein
VGFGVAAALTSVSASTLAGCATAPAVGGACERPATLRVAIAAGPLLNPDDTGTPLPTEVRLYQLRDAARVEGLAFDDVWRDGDAALGDARVSTQVITVYPGEPAEGALAASPDAHALAAVAIVRQPAGHAWRVVVPLDDVPCGAAATITLRVDEYRIEREGALPRTGGT